MRLAFSRPTDDDTAQRLLFASFRAAGFDGLQPKAGQYQRYLREPDRFRADWGEDTGAVSALIAGGTLDDAGIAALRRVITFAHSVRSERVVFCHGVPRRGLMSSDIQGFARLLSNLGREARAVGVRLSLHHHYDQPVMHREDFDRFFEAADEGTVGLTVDTAHLVKSGVQDIAGLIRSFRTVIDNVHLKDYADGGFRVLGEGEIPFGPVLEALREIGYPGWLCADEESGTDLRAGMKASVRFIRTALPPIGPSGVTDEP
jgi:sugar phosphate isomerase/epimerase